MAEKGNTPKDRRKGGIVRGAGRTFLDVPTWFSLNYLKSANKSIFKLAKDSFSAKNAAETAGDFEQVMAKQGVTEADLRERAKTFQRNVFIVGAFAVLVSLYTLYLLFAGSFMSFLVGVAVSALSFVKAYQFSLWGFQIKHRKLGCTFQEWRSGKVSSSSTS